MNKEKVFRNIFYICFLLAASNLYYIRQVGFANDTIFVMALFILYNKVDKIDKQFKELINNGKMS